MAIPTEYDPNQKLYQVRIKMGSQFRGRGVDQGEYQRLITYEKDKQTRREIGAIRQSVNARRAAGCMPFFGAYITNELGRDQLVDVCTKADREMKEIDPELHCTPVFMKLDTPDLMGNTSLFDELLNSMRTQIHKVVLDRIKSKIEGSESTTLTTKSREALLRMLDKTQDLNIVNDPSITADIEKMRARINANELRELRDEILVILDETKDRSAALEIVDNVIDDEEGENGAPAQVMPAPASVPKSARTLDLL
jgi:hypothetical protein